jgi:hypothetical protein
LAAGFGCCDWFAPPSALCEVPASRIQKLKRRYLQTPVVLTPKTVAEAATRPGWGWRTGVLPGVGGLGWWIGARSCGSERRRSSLQMRWIPCLLLKGAVLCKMGRSAGTWTSVDLARAARVERGRWSTPLCAQALLSEPRSLEFKEEVSI